MVTAPLRLQIFHSETYHEKKAKRFRGEFSVKPRIVIEELRN